jgi:NADH-quinone oxidoreductase subunit N
VPSPLLDADALHRVALPVPGNVASLGWMTSELALIAGIFVVLLWDLLAPPSIRQRAFAWMSVAALGVSGLSAGLRIAREEPSRALFGGMLVSDPFAHTFRVLFAVVTAVVVIMSAPGQRALRGPISQRGVAEYHLLLLTAALGLNLMAMSRSLLTVYLSIELVSIMSYILASYDGERRQSGEAGLKYVIFGGVASGVMLYGMSWLFGLTGSLELGAIGERALSLSEQQGRVPEAVFFAVVCILAGFGYKISAAPFHMWTPDVYEGAPTPVTAFFSVGPKAAGFAVLLRFFAEALAARGSYSGAVPTPWPIVGGLLAVATMTLGNLSALAQNNVKRMLAYSSIAHAGYMLLGFAVFDDAGTVAVVFYVATYCFMNLGAFLVVMAVAEKSAGDENLTAFRALGRRAPGVAACMVVFLFSLTGLPPFVGFVGKFYVFAALIHGGGAWYWSLAVAGVLNSVVSLFYYARVVRQMYFVEWPDRGGSERLEVRGSFVAGTFALAVPTVVLGVYWAPLYDFVARSVSVAR